MSHKNSPLTPEGKRRLIERLETGRPVAHVAREMGISRQTATKWWARYQLDGMDGLQEHSSRPFESPTSIPDNVVDLILEIRKDKKWGAERTAAALRDLGVDVSASTVHRTFQRHGVNHVDLIDRPTGNSKREAFHRVEYPNCGDMVHVDVKKVGRIPDGGGWRMHGQGSDEHRRSKRKGYHKAGNIYIHSAVDAHSRMAYSEIHLDEKGVTAAAHWLRSVEFFKRHGFIRFERNMTDNGPAYRSAVYNEALAQSMTAHRFTPPYTPRINGKVEAFNKILNNEWIYSANYTSEKQRVDALADFLNYYNHERNHSALGFRPPISRTGGSDFRLTPQAMEWPLSSGLTHVEDFTLFGDI